MIWQTRLSTSILFSHGIFSSVVLLMRPWLGVFPSKMAIFHYYTQSASSNPWRCRKKVYPLSDNTSDMRSPRVPNLFSCCQWKNRTSQSKSGDFWLNSTFYKDSWPKDGQYMSHGFLLWNQFIVMIWQMRLSTSALFPFRIFTYIVLLMQPWQGVFPSKTAIFHYYTQKKRQN